MTKDTYYEMCDTMGMEPILEEIPVDMEDFPQSVQTLFAIYNLLTDIWDHMNGTYTGKDYSIVFNLFEVYAIEKEEYIFSLETLQHIDSIRSKIINTKISSKNPQTK